MKKENIDFNEWYNLVETLNENTINYSSLKHKIFDGKPIDLSNGQIISSDVIDIRNELETSTCIYYTPNADFENYPILTRVAVRCLVLRPGKNGLEFLCKNKGNLGLMLPGGGIDLVKDGTSIERTAERELSEELNIKVKDIKVIPEASFWKYFESDWVTQHVKNPKNRWYGYYSFIAVMQYDSIDVTGDAEEINVYRWWPIKTLLNKNTQECLKFKVAFEKYIKTYQLAIKEAWGNAHGQLDFTDETKVSYCCESIEALNTILATGRIKTSVAAADGATKDTLQKRTQKYKYVSFSKQLFSHAYRRISKWGFGLIFDLKKLNETMGADGKKLVNWEHAAKTATIRAVFKLKQTDTTYNYGQYYMITPLYGILPITKDLYYTLVQDLNDYSEYKMKNVSDQQPITPKQAAIYGPNATQSSLWAIKDKHNFKDASYHSSIEVEDYYGFTCTSTSHSMPFNKCSRYEDLLNYLKDDTFFNEGELRFLAYNGEDYLNFPLEIVNGVILPQSFELYMEACKQKEIVDNTINKLLAYNLPLVYHDADRRKNAFFGYIRKHVLKNGRQITENEFTKIRQEDPATFITTLETDPNFKII